VERDVGVSFQPLPDLGSVVSGQIVPYDVDLLAVMGFDGIAQEGEEPGSGALG